MPGTRSLFNRTSPTPTHGEADLLPLAASPAAAAADPLTGLGNRHVAIEALGNDAGRSVLMVDFDEFRAVNEVAGHGAGDAMLIEASRRLLRVATEAEGLVTRVGDDEFVVVIPPNTDPLDVADRVRDAVRRPVMLHGRPHTLLASIGVAVGGELPAAAILQAADAAVARAKSRGGDRIEVFDPLLFEQSRRRNEIAQSLRQAIEARQLSLYYQPQVSMSTGLITSVESLLRWEHPSKGLMHPGAFIEVAERSGLIRDIGAEVLRQACTDAHVLLDAAHNESFRISVNVSPSQLEDPHFAELVAGQLAHSELAPEHLCLEVTESSILGTSLRVRQVLRELRDLGVRFSIDDFGTGYSSLSSLRQLPVDELKVDRSFIVSMDDPDGRDLTGAIFGIATALGLDTVAEGVEEESVIGQLRSWGCDQVQGYLYSRPQPLAKVRRALRKDKPRALPPPK